MSLAKLLLASAAVVASSWAQSQPPAFEVASVKPNNSQTRGRRMDFLPGGRLVAQNLPLLAIVSTAYNLPFQCKRLSGSPGTESLLNQTYDIEATAGKGAIPVGSSAVVRAATMRAMMQTLLADRFKMTVRRDTKDTSVYAIVVAKNGPKLQQAKIAEKDCPEGAGPGACHQFTGGQGRGLHGMAVSVSDMALFVSNWTELPAIDKTGLTGLYEVNSPGWTAMQLKEGAPTGVGEDGIPDPDRPTLFDVMAQLGLKLETQKAPVDFFVITHVEKPVEN